MRTHHLFRFVAIGCLCALSLFSEGKTRWGTFADAGTQVAFYHREIDVKKNGEVTETVESLIKILNEEGKNESGTQANLYNDDNETFKILDAKVFFTLTEKDIQAYRQQGSNVLSKIQKDVQTVDLNTVEYRPVASHLLSFDSISQALVSYPNVQVGSYVYLKTQRVIKNAPLPGYFSTNLYYGQRGPWLHSKVIVRSELPFKMHVNDPDKNLFIKESQENGRQVLVVTQNKPILRFTINEPNTVALEEEKEVFIHLSTLENFKAMGQGMSVAYEAVLAQPLPDVFKEIVKNVAIIQNEKDTINAVVSALIDRVRYMGDWRSIQGRMVPRALEDVAVSGVGDCKDFSAMTTRILRELGLKANVCLIHRDRIYRVPKTLPVVLDVFNHAMVKVVGAKGDVYWVDPTNRVAMVDGLFSDIADRPVLVLNGDQSILERVPPINPQHAQLILKNTVTFKDAQQNIHKQGEVTFKGETAESFTGLDRVASPEYIKEMILDMVNADKDIEDSHVQRGELTSRIVRDVTFKYMYEQKDNSVVTNLGRGSEIYARWTNTFTDLSEKQEGISFLGHPHRSSAHRLFKDCHADNVNDLDCEVTSPWFTAKRSYYADKEGLHILEEFTLLKSFMTPADIRSHEFKAIKNKVQRYFGRSLIVFSNTETGERVMKKNLG